MTRRFTHRGLAAVAAVVIATSIVSTDSATPFKLGTFSQGGGRTFVGMVLTETLVVDLAAANAEYEKAHAGSPVMKVPPDMRTLVGEYESRGWEARLAAVAAEAARKRPSYAWQISAVKVLPPVMPQNILNAAVNYTEHGQEMAGREVMGAGPAPPTPKSIPGVWERTAGDTRHNPYVFLKPVGAVVGNGEAIRLPAGRTQIDWECELAVVIGKEADHVPVARAAEHVFGYTLQNDVSDRDPRGDGRHGSDWFLGKGHPTFAPLGPYIVPKAFVRDAQKLAITFTLSGKVMQDSNTERMTHSIAEMVSYVSNIMTLRPGDIISTGSPAGVGAARNVFMKPGDTAVCTIESVGTLTNPVVGSGPATADAGR